MKQIAILGFPSIQLLWKFASFIQSTSIEINTTNRTLTSELLEWEIETATDKYQAKIIKPQASTS